MEEKDETQTEYIFASLGKRVESNNFTIDSHQFSFEGELYETNRICLENFERTVKDVNACPEFRIGEGTLNNELQLLIYFTPSNGTEYSQRRANLVDQFCDVVSLPQSFGTPNSLHIAKFYQELRTFHKNHDSISDEIKTIDVQHPWLMPRLRRYQMAAVRWMIHRERDSTVTDNMYTALFRYFEPRGAEPTLFYYNSFTTHISVGKPPKISLPRGGILADEMGLGKTVEMLALILANRKKKRSIFEARTSKYNFIGKHKLFCICTNKKEDNLINCTLCNFAQHRKCVNNEQSEYYICPNCWKSQDLIEGSATLIVSPFPIKEQWQQEIRRHIPFIDFKILLYNGVKSAGWVSPAVLADYDIVLTDYGIMQNEIYYTDNPTRSLRREKSYIIPDSPLTMVRWWRVCLDEAQMVETPTNTCSRMVGKLPAINRWAITGTPIEKSYENLYGLVLFLDLQPYTYLPTFRSMVERTGNYFAMPMIFVFGKVMWRSSKADVLHELEIPPQTEIIHSITMSDLQNYYYRMEHERCEVQFKTNITKFERSRIGGIPNLYKMNPRNIKSVLEPLRKLRHDITVPSLTNRIEHSTTRKLLTPMELMQHLLSNKELECKSALRSIASDLNGIAAVHILLEEYEEAEKFYKRVLRLATDYQGAISVDSMLQIHAYHNLCHIIDVTTGNSIEKTDYIKKISLLEWKYLEAYLCNMIITQNEFTEITKDIRCITIDLNDKNGSWWWQALCELKTANKVDILFQRLETVLLNVYGNSNLLNGISSITILDMKLKMWWENLFSCRSKIIDGFKEIHTFVSNIKPEKDNSSSKTESFVRDAYFCHLILIHKEANFSDIEIAQRIIGEQRKDKKLCILCIIDNLFKEYECILYDRTLTIETADGLDKQTRGNDNPRAEEWILKTIHTVFKNSLTNDAVSRKGQLFTQLIDGLKKEYKSLQKYWIEVNNITAAYDELNMCKERLQFSDTVADNSKSNPVPQYVIARSEVDLYKTNLMVNLSGHDKEFLRLEGTLKYLKHLGDIENSETEICPICRCEPEYKYSVLECGHKLCIGCLTLLMKQRSDRLTCAVCRSQQKFDNIFYVTCTPEDENEIKIVGQYSKKIECIVRTALKLRNEDPNVKIIIFSHWETVLRAIEEALQANQIKCTSKKSSVDKPLKEFKDLSLGVTCLLLTLTYGSKGLNLIEATQVFLVEPILDPGEELQAIGRVHRMGQTKPTFVHRFITLNTIEENIYNIVTKDDTGKWLSRDVVLSELLSLFKLIECKMLPS